MTSIFEGQPHKTRPCPIKTRVMWVPGLQNSQKGFHHNPQYPESSNMGNPAWSPEMMRFQVRGVGFHTIFVGFLCKRRSLFWGCFLAKAAETEPWKEDWASIRYTHCRHIKIISESFCSRDSFYIIWFCWASTCTKCACWISNQHQVHLRALGFIQPLKPIWNLKK